MTGISRKTMIPRFVRLLLLVLLPSLVLAETAEQRQARVDHLEHAVLAPCCYTEPVAIHQSEIAVKMRLEIVKWVAMGRPDLVTETLARGPQDAGCLIHYRGPESAGLRRRVTTFAHSVATQTGLKLR